MENSNPNAEETETVIDSGVVESIPEVVELTETNLFGLQLISDFSEVASPPEKPIKIGDYLAFKSYNQFDRAFGEYKTCSMASFCTCCVSKDFKKDRKFFYYILNLCYVFCMLKRIIKNLLQFLKLSATCFLFVFFCFNDFYMLVFLVTLKDLLIKSKRNDSSVPCIRWENSSGDMPIPFLGYPFLILGSSRYQCSQGKDMNVSNKDKHRRRREANNDASSKRNLSRPTKKMGCPVTMMCKKIIVFPGLTIPKNTKHNRSVYSVKMRKAFEKCIQDTEEGKKVDDKFGTLLYLTKFPDPTTHQFHLEFSNSLPVLGPSANKEQPSHESGVFLGASFTSVRKMEEAVTKYKVANNARLYVDMKDVLLLNPKTSLIYESITYKCMHIISTKLEKKRGR